MQEGRKRRSQRAALHLRHRHGSGVGDHTVKKIISDWTGVDSLDQITSAGYYFLKQDVELDAPWTPVSGTVLCLNGFNITANGNFNAITVNNGAVFTLTDCQGLQSIAYGKITHARHIRTQAWR